MDSLDDERQGCPVNRAALIAERQRRARERLNLTRLNLGLAQETFSRCRCSAHRAAVMEAYDRFDFAVAEAQEWAVPNAPSVHAIGEQV